jgi:RNA polymerase sigma-70 factor (ECF subfamily)
VRRRPVEVPELTVDRAAPHDDLARLADRDELERAFLDLSIEHRAVLVLTHYVGLPTAEVARILRVPPGTVASRLHYGARAMRAAISRDARPPIATPEPGR